MIFQSFKSYEKQLLINLKQELLLQDLQEFKHKNIIIC